MKNFFISWSGGKDSCYALMLAAKAGMKPCVLINMMNEEGMVSRSHAIPKDVLHEQSRLINVPMITRSASWEGYEKIFLEVLDDVKHRYNVEAGVFGDIDLQAHRDWEEKVCAQAGLEAVLPLWKRNRKELVHAMLEAGIETYIVSCNEEMGEVYLGQRITHQLITQLEVIGIDPCGEDGEYHTLVVNMPMFSERMRVTFGATRKENKFWYIEMQLT